MIEWPTHHEWAQELGIPKDLSAFLSRLIDKPTEYQEHVDFAIAEFRDMKMQPSLERALRHKEILGA